ncbi:PAS/PAC sensor hybrid histidine kinase [Candidatus Magnetomorum sp. HK-1]|nr:PAS/PAC sensor hybrid histidine kinase [Candidatus Magnetomorum sp. HK-1]
MIPAAELEESRKNLKQLFDKIGDFLFVINFQGKILQCNTLMTKRLGYSLDEIKNMHIVDLYPGNQKDQLLNIFSKIKENTKCVADIPMITRNNEKIPTETCATVGRWYDDEVFFCIARDMSERKKLEDTWRKFEFIANSSREFMTLIDRNYRYEAINESYCQAHGMPREKIIGYDVKEIWGESAYRDIIKKHLDECFSGKEVHYEAWFEFQGQERRFYSVRYYGYPNYEDEITHVAVVSRDITDRQLALEALERSETRYRLLVEEMDDLVVRIDANGQILFVNHAVKLFFGVHPNQCIGQNAFDYMLSQDRKLSEKNIARWIREKNKHVVVENQMRINDGSMRNFLWNINFYCDADDEIPTLNCIARDITDLKTAGKILKDKKLFLQKAHDELEQRVEARTKELQNANDQLKKEIEERKFAEKALLESEKEIKQAKEEAELANSSKTIFLANMSHEIRTPISGIIGASEMLLSSNLSTDQKDTLEMIKNSAGSLLTIINDILDISKIEAQKLEIINEDFDLYENIKNYLKPFSIEVRQKGLEMTLKILPDVPRYLNGDSHRLGQVIRNIVSNALKFTDQGQVLITVKNVYNHTYPIHLLFTVSDTGQGIPEDKMPELFKTYSQVDASPEKKRKGTGLGLSISKSIVELMGGRIWAESNPGKGSTFYFTVILDKAINKLSPKPEGIQYDVDTKTVDSIRILLAEDNKLNQKFVSYLLTQSGHQVFCVSDGNEVLQALEQMQFDLILMDVQMPDLDGVATTKKIRLSENEHINSDIPIIALTAYAMKGDRERFINAGMDDYITKPMDFNELKWVMTRVLNSRQKNFADPVFHENSKGQLPSLDRQTGLHRVKGKKELLHELYHMFLKDLPGLINKMESAMKNEEFENLSYAAHRLKSTSGTIGAINTQHIAQQIEIASRNQNIKKVRVLLPELIEETSRLRLLLNEAV